MVSLMSHEVMFHGESFTTSLVGTLEGFLPGVHAKMQNEHMTLQELVVLLGTTLPSAMVAANVRRLVSGSRLYVG